MNYQSEQYTVKYAISLFCRWNANRHLIIDDVDRYVGNQLEQEAKSIAHALMHYGVGKGDTVVLMGGSSCRFYAAYLAVHKLGAISCNIHAQESPQYLAKTLLKVQAKLLICSEAFIGVASESLNSLDSALPLFSLGDKVVDEISENYPSLISHYPSVEPQVCVSPDDPAVIIMSSGSTGTPKGIVHSQGNFVRWLRTAPSLFGAVSKNTRFLVNVGTSFAAWPFSSLPILYANGCIVLMENFTPERFCKAVEKEQVTMAGPVPTMIRRLEPSITEKYDLSSLEMILVAGEPPSENDIERVLSWSDTDIRCLYLASESAPAGATFWELSDGQKLQKPVCAGKPIPGADIRIVDPDGSITDTLAVGEQGEVLIKGPTLSMGYLGDEALTQAKFCDGWWRSGDIGVLDGDGYLTVCGRVDNIINSGGIKIHGEEVEACLIQHPSVSQVAVIGVTDETWGNRIEAHLSCSSELSQDQLKEWCQTRSLAPFKRPKSYVFHSQLPIGATGKLDRRSLRERS